MPAGSSPPFADPEVAREAGRKGGLASARARQLSPEERALEAIKREVPSLVRELLAAAKGEGAFAELKADDRLRALYRALEYGLGRPGGRPASEPEASELPTASDLFAGSGEGESLA